MLQVISHRDRGGVIVAEELAAYQQRALKGGFGALQVALLLQHVALVVDITIDLQKKN